MIGDNPAARLLAILERGKEFKGHENCRNTWKKILEVEGKADSVLMSRLGKVMELPEQIITILKKDFPNQTRTYSHWSAQVNAGFFQQNLNDSWDGFSKHIDSHTLNYLRLNADLIQTKSPTNLINQEQLESLREKVSDLLAELIDSDFEPEFKDFLARALQKMVFAIDEYRISGALPVMDAIEGVFGHAFFDEKYRESLSKTELGGKVVNVLSVVASAMTIALGVPQLPQTFTTYLEILKSAST